MPSKKKRKGIEDTYIFVFKLFIGGDSLQYGFAVDYVHFFEEMDGKQAHECLIVVLTRTRNHKERKNREKRGVSFIIDGLSCELNLVDPNPEVLKWYQICC